MRGARESPRATRCPKKRRRRGRAFEVGWWFTVGDARSEVGGRGFYYSWRFLIGT
jgi:hypothetical protein